MISILSKSKPASPDRVPEEASVGTELPKLDGDAVDPPLAAARVDSPNHDDEIEEARASKPAQRQLIWRQILSYSSPCLVMLAATTVAYLKWQEFSLRELHTIREESVRAATDLTVKMLSYRPDTVEHDLSSARDQMTGAFRDSYSQLTRDVVIPGSKQKRISAVATVAAAASVSASNSRAVVLVFVNQSIVVGDDAPSSTASSVKVTLDRVNNRWLISDFTPI